MPKPARPPGLPLAGSRFGGRKALLLCMLTTLLLSADRSAGAAGAETFPPQAPAGPALERTGSKTGAPIGLHVSGNQLLDSANRAVILRGVNRSGSEYACIQGWGFFDGPSDLASLQAIASWGANSVRIPLNESCWLAINGAPPAYSGQAYKEAISNYVGTVQTAGLVPILELHWSGAGHNPATGQQPTLNRDHSITFWQEVADAYKTNTGVVFDLHNEPYPDGNQDTEAAWTCWRDGTTSSNSASCPGSNFTYQAAGMQELVSAVRARGAQNVIMLGGVQYANALSGWLSHKPSDSAGNLIAAWHVYNFNICSSTPCYNATAAPVAASVPLVAGEIGQNDCGSAMFTTLMNWLDDHSSGYLAWTWDTWGTACASLSLITDYSGTPTSYGQVYKDHLSQIAPTPTPTPAACAPGQYTDVPPLSTFYPYVTCLSERGIVSGYPDCTFLPANPVTRGQLAKIVSNSAGFQEPVTGPMFADVPPGSTFYDYIGRLAARSYVSGYACGGPGEPCIPPGNLPYYRPSALSTRGQISKLVSNAAHFTDPVPGGRHTFSDVPPGSTFHLYVERLLQNRPGAMSGYPCGGVGEPCDNANRPYFRPSNSATRGQTTKIVANTFFPECQASSLELAKTAAGK